MKDLACFYVQRVDAMSYEVGVAKDTHSPFLLWNGVKTGNGVECKRKVLPEMDEKSGANWITLEMLDFAEGSV